MRYLGCILFASLWIAGPALCQNSEELEELFWARRDSALTRFSPADVDFMTGMILHHAQALKMSSFAESNGASAVIQVLAARIINAQNDEIHLMQEWLRKRKQSLPHTKSSSMMHDHHDMPGMLSDAQLKELEVAVGGDFDTLFLEYMIMHHEGAVHMVRELFAMDGALTGDATYRLAADIYVDQTTEINRMRQMLEHFQQTIQNNE